MANKTTPAKISNTPASEGNLFTRDDISAVYAMSIFLVVAVAIAVGSLVAHHFAHFRIAAGEGISVFFEWLVTLCNFIGAMLIAQGVILLQQDRSALNRYPNTEKKRLLEVLKAIFNASTWARRGTFFIIAAFVFDVTAKVLHEIAKP